MLQIKLGPNIWKRGEKARGRKEKNIRRGKGCMFFLNFSLEFIKFRYYEPSLMFNIKYMTSFLFPVFYIYSLYYNIIWWITGWYFDANNLNPMRFPIDSPIGNVIYGFIDNTGIPLATLWSLNWINTWSFSMILFFFLGGLFHDGVFYLLAKILANTKNIAITANSNPLLVIFWRFLPFIGPLLLFISAMQKRPLSYSLLSILWNIFLISMLLGMIMIWASENVLYWIMAMLWIISLAVFGYTVVRLNKRKSTP